MSEERETRLFMISPGSMLTPDQMVRMIHSFGDEVLVKETCYGCLVEGPRDLVIAVRDKIRENYRNEVFTKVRAYPCSDPRRCRAQHGTRPGFAQLEMEWELLARIQYGLAQVEKGAVYVPAKEKKRISVNDFKKICEVQQ
ncbi:MAG: methanogenesis marker protein 6 [Candidatus Methanomethylophilaceae archaeon]|nr:methanogenesis marker protein 6 [Candidatus Methanomethylophilaceae archaeon]